MARHRDLTAESLEKDNIDDGVIKPVNGGDVVFVFANLPNGQGFNIGKKVVTINGIPVSKLQKPGGGFFPGGKFGVTEVSRQDWEQVVRIYGGMRMFKSGAVFSANSFDAGRAMARERGDLRHGFEQVDPDSRRVKTRRKTED